jgi:phosphate transporter
MAIAFACNVGGMPTPIASPQNTAALQAITNEDRSVSFTAWMAFALPFCICMLVFIWLWMLAFWKPTLQTLPLYEKTDLAPWTWMHTYVACVTLFTIGLWCTFQLTSDFFGSLGLIGLLPVILLYGSGSLDNEDFNHMDWSVLMLLGGGAALGVAVESSGLLDKLAGAISELFEGQTGTEYDIWREFMFFNLCVVVATNFISHTVGAITMMPVIAKVGAGLLPSRVVSFVISSVLMTSSACALPVSSFPNVIAFGLKDQHGNPYLKVSDFLRAAAPIELFALVVMGSLGWSMTKLIHEQAGN